MWCVHLRGRVGTSVEVVLFGDVSAYIPQVVVISTSLGTFPRPVPRPLPGVTRPASPECPTPLCRGWLWGWLVVVEGMGVGVVECVGHTSVRRRGCDCWPRCGSSCWPSSVLMAWASLVFEVVGVPAGRGLGGRVSCPRPLPGVTRPASPECPTPLCRGWLLGCRRVAC